MAAGLPPVVRVTKGQVPALKAPQPRGKRRCRQVKTAAAVDVYRKRFQVWRCLRSALGFSPNYPGGPSVTTVLHAWPSTVGPRLGLVPPFFFLPAPEWRYRLGLHRP